MTVSGTRASLGKMHDVLPGRNLGLLNHGMKSHADQPEDHHGAFFGNQEERRCRCSKIMSPLNCNETLSPCEDGDDESERVSTGESD
jgi:hypothetical protein